MVAAAAAVSEQPILHHHSKVKRQVQEKESATVAPCHHENFVILLYTKVLGIAYDWMIQASSFLASLA